MKIQNINRPLAFQKTPKANCAVLKDFNSLPCRIYKLDKEDGDYFKKFSKDSDWDEDHFLKCVEYYFNLDNRCSVYVLEDSNEKCLGYVEVSNQRKDIIDVDYLETCPALIDLPNIKYVGETLLAFIAKIAQRESSDMIISEWLFDALDFYTKKCGFEYVDVEYYKKAMDILDEEDYLILKEPMQDNLLKQNEKHTKTKFNYLF